MVLSALLLSIGQGADPTTEPTVEPVAKVKQQIEEKKGVLVDVREKKEWVEGHIDGAVFLPLSELSQGMSKEQLAEKLPKDRVLYTYCVIGKRALTAAKILEKAGYQVHIVKPGYQTLIDGGFTTAKGE